MGVEEFTLMQQFPKEESRLSAPITPFNYDVNYDKFSKMIFQLNIITIGLDSFYFLHYCVHYNDGLSRLYAKSLRNATSIDF